MWTQTHIAARLKDVAEKLHITHILHKMPGQLSGGERQRVAIARALVRDPAAYLMDDPISALDARLREETRVELKRIQREAGRTLIYVTHDQEEAMSVADRMAILEKGTIRQIGRPVEIYDHPATTYVAHLLGSPVMNILPARRTGASYDVAEGTIQLTAPDGLAGVAELGLRPEDLRVTPWQGGSGRPATVTEVEPLGGYTVVTLIRRVHATQGPDARPTRHPRGGRNGAGLRPRTGHLFRGQGPSPAPLGRSITMSDAMGFQPDPTVRTNDLAIGCIGAGMIMAECHLAAYKEAGFKVAAIASRTKSKAETVAARYGIAKVHDTPEALIADPSIEVLDIAYPPDQQPALIYAALKQPHIKAILAQKAAGPDPRRCDCAPRCGGEGGQDPQRQPEHALRPVDAGAETDPRPGRPGRNRLRPDRHARHPALAGLPRRLRPPDAGQHVGPPPRHPALSVRRPGSRSPP